MANDTERDGINLGSFVKSFFGSWQLQAVIIIALTLVAIRYFVVDYALQQVEVAVLGYDVESMNEDDEIVTSHVDGIADKVMARATNNFSNQVLPQLGRAMRNSGNSLIHELTEVAISKEQRLGVSLNSFMKVAFGVYNPHYEGLSNGSIDGTSRVDYFGDDLNWIRIAPAKPVRRQSTPTETETGSEEVPEKKTNIWGN